MVRVREGGSVEPRHKKKRATLSAQQNAGDKETMIYFARARATPSNLCVNGPWHGMARRVHWTPAAGGSEHPSRG